MDHNQDREAAVRENRARTRVLSKEVRHLREEKSKQVSTVLPDSPGPAWLRGGLALLVPARPRPPSLPLGPGPSLSGRHQALALLPWSDPLAR